jgi:hypothetical protein
LFVQGFGGGPHCSQKYGEGGSSITALAVFQKRLPTTELRVTPTLIEGLRALSAAAAEISAGSMSV